MKGSTPLTQALPAPSAGIDRGGRRDGAREGEGGGGGDPGRGTT